MTTRVHNYVEGLTSKLRSSSTLDTHTGLTFTPAIGRRTAILFSGTAKNVESSGVGVTYELRQETGPTLRCAGRALRGATDDVTPISGMFVQDASDTPVEETYNLRYASTFNTFDIRVADVAIIALQLSEGNDGDQYVQGAADNTTSASYQDNATLTFSPDNVGEYLIIATAEMANNSIVSSIQVRLDNEGSPLTETNFQTDNSADWHPWMAVLKTTLSAGNHTFKIQFKANGTIQANIRRGRILALRLGGFADNRYEEKRSIDTTTSSSFVNYFTSTDSDIGMVDEEDYLLIYTVGMGGGSSSDRYEHKLMEEAIDLNVNHPYHFRPLNSGGTGIQYSGVVIRKRPFPEDPSDFLKSYTVDFRRSSGSTGNAIIDETAVALLELVEGEEFDLGFGQDHSTMILDFGA